MLFIRRLATNPTATEIEPPSPALRDTSATPHMKSDESTIIQSRESLSAVATDAQNSLRQAVVSVCFNVVITG